MLTGTTYNVFTDLLMFCSIFVGGTPLLSLIFTQVHRMKASCCGKKSEETELDIRMIEDTD